MKKGNLSNRGLWVIVLLLCFGISCRPKSSIYLVVDDANGLKAGNKVLANGVDIGKVDKVLLEGKHVVCKLSIKDEVQISRRSSFSIRPEGLLGGRQVEVTLSDIGPFLADGDTIVGRISTHSLLDDLFGKDSTFNMDSLKKQIGQSFKDLGNVIDSLDLEGLGDSIKLKFKESGVNLDSLRYEFEIYTNRNKKQ